MMAMAATILIADEHALFRAAVTAALQADGDLRVVGETSDSESLRTECARLDPDVALVDIALPGRQGALSVISALTSSALRTRFLLLADTPNQSQLVAALEAGAAGYVTRDNGLSELTENVRAALRGEACVPRRMLGGLLHELIQRRRELDEAERRLERLSKREVEVLRLLGEGMGHNEIAVKLVISPQTARTHIQNVLAGLDVHSRLEAAAFAVEVGLVDAERR